MPTGEATISAADQVTNTRAGALRSEGMQSDRVVEPVPRQQTLETLFNSLVAEWRQSLTPSTTLSSLLAHPAYNRIIGMGLLSSNAVVPLILKDLSIHPR